MRTKDFSQTELDNMMPWELPRVADLGTEEHEAQEDDPEQLAELPTVEEIEAMQQRAFEEAAEQGRQEGYQNGLEEGRRAGFEEGRSELEQRIREFDDLIRLLNEPLLDLDQQIESELVALAVAIAKQLIRRELKTDPGQIIAVVKEAIRVLPAYSRNIQVSMHPEDVELLRSTLGVEESNQAWTLTGDPLLTRGGCRVETDSSRIDATVESRIAQVVATVLGGERKQD